MTTTFDIVAISVLAERLREPEGRVRDAAAQLGIRRAGRINGEDHLDERDAERVRAYLDKREGK